MPGAGKRVTERLHVAVCDLVEDVVRLAAKMVEKFASELPLLEPRALRNVLTFLVLYPFVEPGARRAESQWLASSLLVNLRDDLAALRFDQLSRPAGFTRRFPFRRNLLRQFSVFCFCA